MSRLKIHDYLTTPTALRRVAREVREEEFGTDAFQTFVQDMAQTVFESGGLGLAATQVDAHTPDGGVWALFVLHGPFEPGGDPRRWICVANPKITRTGPPVWGVEGCLSFRSVGILMRAPSQVTGEHQNEEGRRVQLTCDGTHARAYAHEVDHLRGRVLIDRLSHNERRKFMTGVGKQRRADG